MIELVKQQPELKKRVLSEKQQKQHKSSFGAWGECRAITHLKIHGYVILETNVQFRHAEVDIIAQDPRKNIVVFVEVKTRKTTHFGNPGLAVTRKKVYTMQKVARKYLTTHRLHNPYRFDIIAISPGRVEHFENITWFGV